MYVKHCHVINVICFECDALEKFLFHASSCFSSALCAGALNKSKCSQSLVVSNLKITKFHGEFLLCFISCSNLSTET